MNMLDDSLVNSVKQREWGGGLTVELQDKKI